MINISQKYTYKIFENYIMQIIGLKNLNEEFENTINVHVIR